MKIRQKTTIGLAAALVLAGGTTAGIAVAANNPQTPAAASQTPQRAVAALTAAVQKPANQPVVQAPAAAPISQEQAVQTALAQSPGAVLESAKLDAKDNYWEIDLTPGQGQTQHVDYKIDALTGSVRSVDTDNEHAAQIPAAPVPVDTSHNGHTQNQEAHEAHTPAQEQAHQAKEQREQAKEQAEKAQEKSSEKHLNGKED